MGKKTKKTRWRTLSIGDSDTESGNIKENSRNNPKYGRNNGFWYNSSSNQKYSNQSTPIKHQHQPHQGENPKINHFHHHHRYERHEKFERHERNDREQWNGHYTRSSNQETSKSTTRSSSTVSENKIKFNEDEYTRITTPRQDVLFKKGYLSKPKPYLQQQQQQQQQLQQQCSLTSTGNSTGDGTPDHQSADGNEIIDGDYDQSPFMFPPSNSNFGMDGMFFVNGFEPYAVPPHHVLLYDQYGNTVVCLPSPPPPPPPPPHSTAAAATATIEANHPKRCSLDSMTESASPHNEDAASNTTDQNEAEAEAEAGDADVDAEESSTVRIRKKRRRKKTTDNEDKSNDISSDELSSLSGDEHHRNQDEKDEVSSSSNSCKYRVDAEEFVPRCYRQQQQLEYVQLPVGMPLFVPTMYPLTNHQIYFNNPHHFTTTPITTTTTTITNEASTSTTTTTTSEATTSTNGIDIAKIVSKLEQAAKEQQETETETETIDVATTTITIEELKPEETNKTESVPLTTINKKPKPEKQQEQQAIKQEVEVVAVSVAATTITENVRYSERLKQSNNQVNKKVQQQQQKTLNNNSKQQQQQQQRRTTQICPRLERKPKTTTSNTCTNNNCSKTIVSQATCSSDQWIAVSGKKKRGKNKRLLSSEEIETEIEEVEVKAEEECPEIIEVKREAPPQPIAEPEIKSEQMKLIETIAKPNQQNKKGITKKRILINDELLNVPKNQQELVDAKEVKEKTVVIVAPQQSTIVMAKAKKKTNKKTSKSNKTAATKLNECNNNIDKTTITPAEIQSEFDEDGVGSRKDENDDVSLELDRMIQRGLYGNLEERIRSFNPADSFIVDVIKQSQVQAQDTTADAAAVAAASVIGTMAAAVLKKPSTYFGQTSAINPTVSVSVSNGYLAPKVIINKSNEMEVIKPDVVAGENQRFPITRAVREWMNKTRENTPEIEIFKRPNEIRQEFQLIAAEDDENIDDDQLDAMSPPSQVDEVEVDLLDCWEPEREVTVTYEHQQQADVYRLRRSVDLSIGHHEQLQLQQLNVEQGVDVLETYESVYGRSDDFARIQREVLEQQQEPRTSTSNYNLRVGGVDGALPYRAICCSIM